MRKGGSRGYSCSNFLFDKKPFFMNRIPFAIIIAMASSLAMADPPCSLNDSVLIFTGTTPCSNMIRPIHKISPEPDCQWKECMCILVEWKLELYRNPSTLEPTRYKLTGINRFCVKETNMYSQPGTKTESEGKWTIVKGSKTNPAAILYRLNPDNPDVSIDMIRLSDNLLHILDHEGRLMIGNEFHSYTLNRLAN